MKTAIAAARLVNATIKMISLAIQTRTIIAATIAISRTIKTVTTIKTAKVAATVAVTVVVASKAMIVMKPRRITAVRKMSASLATPLNAHAALTRMAGSHRSGQTGSTNRRRYSGLESNSTARCSGCS